MSDSNAPLSGLAKPSGYHDFGGLAGLRSEAARGADSALRETAKQFEAYFIQQTMKSMRESVEKSDLFDNNETDMFQDMMDKEVASKMAERGSLGLADMIERTLTQRQLPAAPPRTQEVLAARAGFPLVSPASPVSLTPVGVQGLPLPRTGGLALDMSLYGRSPQQGQAAPALESGQTRTNGTTATGTRDSSGVDR